MDMQWPGYVDPNTYKGLLQAEKPRFDHRFSFEHFGISTVAQGRRVKALGAVVSTNPYYVYERADLSIPQLGTDRASLAARMRHCRIAALRYAGWNPKSPARGLDGREPHRGQA